MRESGLAVGDQNGMNWMGPRAEGREADEISREVLFSFFCRLGEFGFVKKNSQFQSARDRDGSKCEDIIIAGKLIRLAADFGPAPGFFLRFPYRVHSVIQIYFAADIRRPPWGENRRKEDTLYRLVRLT